MTEAGVAPGPETPEPDPSPVVARWPWLWPGPSGPAVARVFQRALAAIFLVAWISLGSQIRVLIGARGLMPLGELLSQAAGQWTLSWKAYPSLLRWPWLVTDQVLVGGTVLGALIAVVALLGLRPRLCLALSTALYLCYVPAGQSFLSFQWDNLLLECGVLAVFLSADRPAPVAHLLLRLLAFKLYFESGLAKWQSPLGDWQDGSAMTFYYETAPLPTALAFYAHHLPVWWHHLESRATLVLELVVPFGLFAPRRGRLVAVALLTVFQLINAATANYGFFCALALALHLFALDDRNRPVAWLARLPARTTPPPGPSLARTLRPRLFPARWVGLGAWVGLSLLSAAVHFTETGSALLTVAALRAVFEPLRLVNSYHLFASITRERVEPQFEVRPAPDGAAWQPLEMWHKAGDVRRRPGFVAPHQPRVDFQLWFHGLGYTSHPLYVVNLVRRLCSDPAAVAPLFRAVPRTPPTAVRITYQRYRFSTPAERRASGAWWKATLVDTTAPIPCDR